MIFVPIHFAYTLIETNAAALENIAWGRRHLRNEPFARDGIKDILAAKSLFGVWGCFFYKNIKAKNNF